MTRMARGSSAGQNERDGAAWEPHDRRARARGPRVRAPRGRPRAGDRRGRIAAAARGGRHVERAVRHGAAQEVVAWCEVQLAAADGAVSSMGRLVVHGASADVEDIVDLGDAVAVAVRASDDDDRARPGRTVRGAHDLASDGRDDGRAPRCSTPPASSSGPAAAPTTARSSSCASAVVGSRGATSCALLARGLLCGPAGT